MREDGSFLRWSHLLPQTSRVECSEEVLEYFGAHPPWYLMLPLPLRRPHDDQRRDVKAKSELTFCCTNSSACSVSKLCPALCDPMDCSTPGFPALHYLPKFAQTHIHRVGDAIRPFLSCMTKIFLSLMIIFLT